LRDGEEIDVPQLGQQEQADDQHDDVNRAAEYGLVRRDESRRG
jgi:hypothetical protein